MKEELQAYHIGEAIKQARQAKNLTQEELGERIGVQKAQISRLEKGKNITISSLMRLFEAMEVPLTLEMGGIGKISLCSAIFLPLAIPHKELPAYSNSSTRRAISQ